VKPIYSGLFEACIPEGRWVVMYRGDRLMHSWGKERWLVAFEVVDTVLLNDVEDALRQAQIDKKREELRPFVGTCVPRIVARISSVGRPSMASGFAADWHAITGRRRPTDLARRRPRELYSGCSLEVQIETVKLSFKGQQLHPDDYYSIVREVIRLRDGSPPCMRGRDQTQPKPPGSRLRPPASG
jgi:hypothetical protein